MRIVLPWPDKKLNPNARLHWRAKHAAKAPAREAVRLIGVEAMQAHGLKQSDLEGTERIDLIVSFYPPDNRHRDDDNMVGSFKTLRDGLADAFGVNDRRFRAHYFFHEPDRPGRIEVELEVKHRVARNLASTLSRLLTTAVDGLPTSKGRSA